MDTAEDAVRETPHEETAEFTRITRRGFGKLRGDFQRATHCNIKTAAQSGHQFLLACPRLEQLRFRSGEDDYFHVFFRSASRANVSSIGLACEGSAR